MSSQLTRDSGSADVVLRVGRVYDFTAPDAHMSSLAVRDGRVLAVGQGRELNGLVGPNTTVVEDPGLTVLPSYFDTHNHLFWTSSDVGSVDLEDAGSVADIVARLRERAARTPPGEWIVSARRWHESTIAERRLPTATELDGASPEHPILVRRGGHVAVANSAALRLAGITSRSPDPEGGTVVRDAAGHPKGPLIEFPAFEPIMRLLPQPSAAHKAEALAEACRRYNARGIGAVRDPGVDDEAVDVYQALRDSGRLTVRSTLLYALDPSASTEHKLAQLDAFSRPPGWGDELLRVDGLKIFSDGGVEGGWQSAAYANQPGYFGHPLISRDDLVTVVDSAVRRGWKIGCHAVGDRAVVMVVDAYEQVLRRHPGLPPGTLVIEHAFFADAELRARAIALGIAVTVQHPLLYALAGNMLEYWGPERTEHVMPVRQWLDEGALVAAGSDCNVTPVDPLLSVWGLVSRGTQVGGVQGPQHGIDRATAFRLYTADAARLAGVQGSRGRLAPGYAADLVGYRSDPVRCDLDDLPGLAPCLTLVGGSPVYNPEGMSS